MTQHAGHDSIAFLPEFEYPEFVELLRLSRGLAKYIRSSGIVLEHPLQINSGFGVKIVIYQDSE